MALLPPYDFRDNPAWWARGEKTWWSLSKEWAYRPTEWRALMRISLKNWALRDGHYWDWLNETEQQLHLADLWMIHYLPMLRNAQQRAHWAHHTLYPHLSQQTILTIWETIDAVLYEYAYQKVSLSGVFRELWAQI